MRAALALIFLLATASEARATYSIAATDAATQQVGGSGTSCVGPNLSVSIIYGSAPGHGAVNAQALLNTNGRDRAVELLELDRPPADIITELTSQAFDPDAERRQYGIVDLAGRAAGFSGSRNGAFSGDRQGSAGSFTYTVQGNILTSRAVIDQAAAAFEGGGCDLADRLMLALEAGADNGEGDSRCTPSGIPSDGAFIQVDRPGEPRGSYLRLRADNTAPQSPLIALRQAYDQWRSTHPCPQPIADAEPALDAPAAADAPAADAPAADAPAAGAPAADARAAQDAGEAPANTRSRDEGCGCTTTAARKDSFGLLLALLTAASLGRARRSPPTSAGSHSPSAENARSRSPRTTSSPPSSPARDT